MTKRSLFGKGYTRRNLLNPVAAALREWHPGHWYVPKYGAQDSGEINVSGRLSAASWATLINKLDAHPAIVGLTWRANWRELEPTEGNFDAALDILEQRCVELAEIGKKFMLLLPTRSFSVGQINLSEDGIAPSWAQNATYGGGHFPYSMSATSGIGHGYAICWYNANVQTKMAILSAAIAARFVGNSTFHGIGLAETSIPTRLINLNATTGIGTTSALSAGEITEYFNGLFELTDAFRTAAPLKMAFQYINFPRNKLSAFVARLEAAGIGLGGPDVFVDPNQSGGLEHSTGDLGAYHYHRNYIGILPRILNVQPYNYRYLDEERVGAGILPTAQQLLDVCKSSYSALQVNYLIWTEDFGGDAHTRGSVSSPYPNFDNSVMALLEAAPQLVDGGGLLTARPSSY